MNLILVALIWTVTQILNRVTSFVTVTLNLHLGRQSTDDVLVHCVCGRVDCALLCSSSTTDTLYCTTLQPLHCTAVTGQCTALHYTALNYIALHCTALH